MSGTETDEHEHEHGGATKAEPLAPLGPVPKRSAAFRRGLLGKLPSLTYERQTGGARTLRITDELGSIAELDADAFINHLRPLRKDGDA